MKKLMLVAAISLATVGAVEAQTIRATSGLGPSHVLATEAYPTLFEKLAEFTDGRWTGNDTPSGLLALNEMNQGLRDGVSEMGTMVLPYFAAAYPEASLVAELSMVGSDNRAISSAVTEYTATCADCIAEFRDNGQIYLGSDTTPTYAFLSKTPIHSSEDMQGLRIRTAGAVFTRLVESMGAEPVQMPASELFEALSQGVIDATYSSVSELKNARLYDVVTNVTEINQGVFNAAAVTNVSMLLWETMDPADRQALAHAAQYAQAIAVEGWREAEAESRVKGAELGIEFINPSEDLIQKASEFKEQHQATVVETLTERGVKNAEEKVARYLELVEKWHGLVEGVNTPEELAELRYQEIWSKVDFASYGL